MLRFQEALGRNYDDPTSDSSWAPSEIRDLDKNQGSHIQPGKLRNAVRAGRIKDLDNYFQIQAVLSEPDRLKKEVNALMSQIQGMNNQIQMIEQRMDQGLDARTMTVSKTEISQIKTQRNNIGLQITEKQDKIAELVKSAPTVPPAPPVKPVDPAPAAASATAAAAPTANTKPAAPTSPPTKS